MNVQIIKKGDRAEYAVLPYATYLRLLAMAENAADIRSFDEAIARDEETLPHAMVARLVNGESPIAVWREHRGLTQQALAKSAGITKSYLSQIESGRRPGSVRVLKSLARALRLDVDDLAGW